MAHKGFLLCIGLAAATLFLSPLVKAAEGGVVTVTVSLAGDCTLGADLRYGSWGGFDETFDKLAADGSDPYGYFLGGVKAVFEAADIAVVNLEGPLTEQTEFTDKTYVFKGSPDYARILTEGGVDAANMANNHAQDYGWAGYIDTRNSLTAAGVSYFGTDMPLILQANGVNVGFLGYMGMSYWTGDRLAGDVAALREAGADLVVVSFHWGEERTYSPNDVQRQLGRQAIDAGADLVVGHHPHVIQGIEEYNGRYIVYSLANFCFGGNRNPGDKDTFIYTQTFAFDSDTLERKPARDKVRITPCSVSSVDNRNDFRPTILTGADGERVMSRLAEYSAELNDYDLIEKLTYKRPRLNDLTTTFY